MVEPSNAGPFDVSPEDPIDPGETFRVRFGEVEAGPAGKQGYLEKAYGRRGGLDYLFIVNTSPQLIKVESQAGVTFIPSATSQNLDEGPYRYLYVTNEGSGSVNNDSTDKVAVQVGNGERSQEQQGGTESTVGNFIDYLVPRIQS